MQRVILLLASLCLFTSYAGPQSVEPIGRPILPPDSNPKLGIFLDQGGAVFNVKAYGATGDGATDDSSAINSAISAITKAGAGTLYFPQGTYYSGTCEFSITVPTAVVGVGQLAVESSQRGSLIQCGSTTANLFNVTSDLFTVRDIAFTNATSSTAGAAIYMNGPHPHSRINAEDFAINGFYDAIDINAAAHWDISQFHITNPVRYGISVQNVLYSDAGDWDIHDGSCVGGPQTDTSTIPGSSACIAVFTSGGGKIHTIKSDVTYTHGIYMNLSNSGQTLMTELNIENTTNSPIYIAKGWPYIVITDSYLNAPPNYPAIYFVDADGYYIGSNVLQSWGTNSSAAIVLINAQLGTIGPNHTSQNFASASSVICDYSCVDLSWLTTGTNTVYRCTASGTLPAGALTTDPANCGSTADTGLRVN